MVAVLNRGPLRLSRIAGLFVVAIFAPAGASPPAKSPANEHTPAADFAARFSSLGNKGETEAALQMLDRAIYADLVAATLVETPPARPEWTLEALQKSLSSNTGLLALHPTGGAVCAALVLQRRVQCKVLDVVEVPELADRLQRWLADPVVYPFDPGAAWGLERSLVAPFRRGLQGLKRLVIVESGCLRGLPFESFLLVEPVELPSDRPPFLVHRYEVSYEATLGSRLAWAAAASSELLWQQGQAASELALQALAASSGAARGVLVFRAAEDLEAWRESLAAERDGGRRRDATALRRVKLARIRARRTGPVEDWAFWLLYGSP